MGNYVPQKGKVYENNDWRKAVVIFRGPFPFRQIFPHINHKLMK